MPNEEEIDEFEAGRIYTKETYKAITELWKEKNITDVFLNYRAIDFHIFDGSDYFFFKVIIYHVFKLVIYIHQLKKMF